jgi:hypothetical protein
MNSTPDSTPSKSARIVGWILTILPAAMLVFSAVMKLLHPPQLDEGFKHLELPLRFAFGLGLLELGCTVVYLIPRTAVLGAVLLTGYLGGAILTHLRIGEAVWMHVLFGVAIWGGVWLRDPRLRTLLPLR